MHQIYKYEGNGGHTITVFDAGTTPVTFVIKCDAPGERAISVPVPEGYFAAVVNRINLGDNFGSLPGEVREFGDSDGGTVVDKQV